MPDAHYEECFAACNSDQDCLAFELEDNYCIFHDAHAATAGPPCVTKNPKKYVGAFQGSPGSCADDYSMLEVSVQDCAEACTGSCMGFSARDRGVGVDCAFTLSDTTTYDDDSTCYRVPLDPVEDRDNTVIRFENATFDPARHDTVEFRKYVQNMIAEETGDDTVRVESVSSGSVIVHISRTTRREDITPPVLTNSIVESGDPYDLEGAITVSGFGEAPPLVFSKDDPLRSLRAGLIIGCITAATAAAVAYYFYVM